MGRGECYEVRLAKPYPLSNLRSEGFDWFLEEVDRYEPKQESVALWALGGAGFIPKTATIYIDPYVGGSVESDGVVLHRMIPIPFDASAVNKIDATVVTHEDLDHLNEDSTFPVSENTRCTFIGPSSVAELLENSEEKDTRAVPGRERRDRDQRDKNDRIGRERREPEDSRHLPLRYGKDQSLPFRRFALPRQVR